MAEAIVIHRDGRVARITLNRPETGNTLTLEMIRQLAERLSDAGADPTTKVVVVRGAGEDFCRGRDPGPKREGPPPSALEVRQRIIEPILAVYSAIREVPVPVVSVVTGAAIGFGCALAGAADVTIVSERSRFALPEMRGDLPPTLAISALMERVPMKALAYLVYSTTEIDAATALSLGLVSRVIPHPELESEVGRFLDGLTQRSVPALAAVKQYLGSARRMEPDAAAGFAGHLLANVLSSR
jgi:enoyl-CoA hydratase/carnithine racemase